MSLLPIEEKHEQAKHRSVVAKQKFLTIAPSNPDHIYCFYEGKTDSDYYYNLFPKNKRDNIFNIVCNGKSGILSICRYIKDDIIYQTYKLLYFIDKDFDPSYNVTNPDLTGLIFETTGYSVENYYCSINCFKRILKFGFKIN